MEYNTETANTNRTIAVSALTTIIILLLAGVVAIANRDGIAAYFNVAAADNSTLSLDADEQQSQVEKIVTQVNPAVVSIVISKEIPVLEHYYREFGPFQIPYTRQNGTEEQEVGGGSGFFVSAEGLIITNKHVVSDPDATYTAVTSSGEHLAVTVVARDPVYDIAVLKVSDKHADFPALDLRSELDLKLGQSVIAIGNALGQFQNSVSVGVVSGLSRSIVAGDGMGESERLENVIQTDAAINPGNSGGPLLDLDGKVIGVNVAVALGSENIGFALPAPLVADVLSSVEKYGEIRRPYLGVRYLEITPEVAKELSLSVQAGALVQSSSTADSADEPAVLPGSPAAIAGIKNGDIIIAFAGQEITSDNSLAQLVRGHQAGDKVAVTILRDGKKLNLSVVLEQAPENLAE
jgi:serine protease Do